MATGGTNWNDGWIDAWRLAVGTLTRFPVTPPGVVDRRTAGRAVLLAPATVLPVAVVWWFLGLIGGRGADLLLAAAAVAVLAAWSRALHLDGLADLADGLASATDATRSLAVMHRSDIGPAGVVVVTLVILIDVAALLVLAPDPAGRVAAGTALLMSRQSVSWLCRQGVSAAQPRGLGAAFAGSVPTRSALLGAVLIVVGAVAVAAPSGVPGAAAVMAVGLAALSSTQRVAVVARRRLGGVTGDVLGAGVEVSLCAGLVVAACVVTIAGG